MTKENLQDLLITKFYSAPKKLQEILLGMMLENAPDKDKVVDFLNGKKLHNQEKNFSEKDFIYISTDVSCYPRINKKYYEDNDLIINDLYIRVQVSHFNPITGYTCIKIYTENNKEEVVDIYTSYIPDQKEVLFM